MNEPPRWIRLAAATLLAGACAAAPMRWHGAFAADAASAGRVAASDKSAAPNASESVVTPQLIETISAGMNYLASQQNVDGSFDGGGPKVAMTALSLMSFLAAGHVQDSGKYGLVVHHAIDYLLAHVPDDGYAGRVDGSRMYGQGIIALALTEAYGVEEDAARRKQIMTVLQRMLKVIEKAQDVNKPKNYAGGWRYEPQSGDSDLSLSGWNALTLRAMRGIGLDVPKARVDRAVGFVVMCFRPEQKGFSYQPGGEPSLAMTGVGLLNMYLLASAERPELPIAGAYLTSHPINQDTPYPYYAAYYATQAAYQAGGVTWQSVWSAAHQHLSALQQKDGGWPQSKNGEEPGRIYATAMSLLTLSVPYRILPIYQR